MIPIHRCFQNISGYSAVGEQQLVPIGLEYPISDELRKWEQTAEFKTTPELFLHGYREHAERPYLGKRVNGEFVFESYAEVYAKIRSFASALLELGFEPGDRVANFSNNRQEWPVVDFGCGFAACVHVPMYPTLSQSELAHIVKDSGARCIIVATGEHLRKLLAVEDECPQLEHIISIEPFTEDSQKQLWSWSDFLEFGRVHLQKNTPRIEYLLRSLRPWDVASLVYTSGTTGAPKGVMLMHGNFCSQAELLRDNLSANCEDSELSFLPLSHVFERVIYYLFTSVGAAIGYTSGIHTVMQDLRIMRPTIFPSVPVLFDKIYNRVMESNQMRTGPSLKWAIKVGRSYSAAKRAGKVSKILQAQQAMAQRVVASDMQKKSGGRIRVLISGGAPLRPEVAQFFWECGLRLLEGYGLTETSPVLTLNPYNSPKFGSVGKAVAGTELKIEDGEVLARGPNIMRGYFNHPEESVAVLDEDGWFHTGDIGHISNGYLTITDRKKCIIVLANGKNVAPAVIEQLLCGSKWISRAVVVGDNAQFVAALIVPDFDKLDKWAIENGLTGTHEELVANEEFKSLIFAEVRSACLSLSNYEKVKRIHIMSRDFSVEAGEVTHSLKVKHRVIEEHYAELIKELLSV